MTSESFEPSIRSFKQLIDQFSPDLFDKKDLLPFCHTTREGYATAIINENAAKASLCNVYKEDLIYFFYGKSSYIIDPKELASFTDDPPVCFIFNADSVEDLMKRILPFDSGGYDRYNLRAGFEKERFTYPDPRFRNIIGYINLIYTTHENYIEGKVDLDKLNQFKDVCIEIEEMIRMFDKVKTGAIKVGKQVYSLEIQYNTDVAFKPTHLVIPYIYYTKPYWSKHFAQSYPAIKLEHYGENEHVKNNGQPLENGEYHRLMREKVADIIALNTKSSDQDGKA